jgi:DNA-binding transcriptional MerR regulator
MAVPEIRRLYYSMKDACAAAGVSPHALKSWEKRFPRLKPAQNKSGKRLYRPDDIQLILRIRDLIAGGAQDAEIVLILDGELPPETDARPSETGKPGPGRNSGWIVEIRRELQDLLNIMKE